MKALRAALRPLLVFLLVVVMAGTTSIVRGAGVTLLTHGYSSSVTNWVLSMSDKAAAYRPFPGTNASVYILFVTPGPGGSYVVSQTLYHGVSPAASDSGEIIIAMDWSSLSSGSVPTTDIAGAAAGALLSTSLFPELNGRPLAQLPLHIAGHSRGGSVVTELARVLGAQGVWVDQVTTLDPHPVALFGDPAVKNYGNVLFTDNYWQNLGDGLFVPNGQSVSGAYNRQLLNLSGGYNSTHSDVHLWYHGTLDLAPSTTDGDASLTASMRSTWYTSLENSGTNAGFLYSLIAGGNRFSTLEPAGAGNGRIIDGVNQLWNFGAGLASNRDRLPVNNGFWPNLLRVNVLNTNAFPVGTAFTTAFFHQFGSNTLSTGTIRFYLDSDHNPFNGNETELGSVTVPSTGTNSVPYSSVNLTPNPWVTTPGVYAFYAGITANSRTRYLYAPEPVRLLPSIQAPLLTALSAQNANFHLVVQGFPGQTIVLQASTNLTNWISVQTNLLTGYSLEYLDSSVASPQRFYRAVLVR